MTRQWLEVTYRKGKPFAAYLYLPRRSGDEAARTERQANGLIVDFAADGRPIGIEIPAPATTTADMVNDVLRSLHVATSAEEDLAPLKAG